MDTPAFTICSMGPPFGSGEWSLYNVADDPGETRNLAGKMPDRLMALITAWDEYADDVGVVLTGEG